MPIPRAELLHMAYRLGADVPFFMLEGGCALAWGHGQRMLRLPATADHADAAAVARTRRFRRREAYGWIDEMRHSAGPRGSVALDLDVLQRWSDIARLAGNDFEAAVFGRFPAIRAAFEAPGKYPSAALPDERIGLGALRGLSERARSRRRGEPAGLEVRAPRGHRHQLIRSRTW